MRKEAKASEWCEQNDLILGIGETQQNLMVLAVMGWSDYVMSTAAIRHRPHGASR